METLKRLPNKIWPPSFDTTEIVKEDSSKAEIIMLYLTLLLSLSKFNYLYIFVTCSDDNTQNLRIAC